MTLEPQTQRNSVSIAPIVDYAAGDLKGLLLDLQQRRATGHACIEAPAAGGIFRRVIVLRHGTVVYGGASVPSPHAFVGELARHVRIGTLDAVLEFAAKRTSVQSVMRAMVDIGVLQWPVITAAMKKQAIAVLEEVLPIAGRLNFAAEAAAFDLCYGEKAVGFTVNDLLADCEIRPPGELAPLGVGDSQANPPQEPKPKPKARPAGEPRPASLAGDRQAKPKARPAGEPVPLPVEDSQAKPPQEPKPKARSAGRPAPAPLLVGDDKTDLPQEPKPKPKLKVLSVDDSPVAQALVRRTLSRDYEIVACDSAIAALEILDRMDDIVILLLDLTMPDMDGLELCRMLRRVERYKELPVIMLTARDGIADRLRGRFAGATHYLAKPIKPAELLALVAQHARAFAGA